LLTGETSALGARISRRLITRAKERSGIVSTTDLVEYALAKVALEDDFGTKLVSRKGSIPPEDVDLPLVSRAHPVGRELLLDTCVYIDVLQGRAPSEVDQLLQTRIVNHSTVALAELTHLIGAVDPTHAGTAHVLKILGTTIDDIPPHRLTAPSTRAFGEAGMLAGLTARLTSHTSDVTLLNDAALFLQAAEIGFDLLTANIRNFDWFDQRLPGSGLPLQMRDGCHERGRDSPQNVSSPRPGETERTWRFGAGAQDAEVFIPPDERGRSLARGHRVTGTERQSEPTSVQRDSRPD
jgi:hypothetical protein